MDITTKQRQIEHLRRTIQLPGVPADEKRLYEATIRRIESELQQATSVQQPEKKAPAAKINAVEIVLEDYSSGEQFANVPTSIPTRAKKNTQVFDCEDMPEITIEAATAPGPRRVKVVWQDDDRTEEYLTEGEARSRFCSYLRDVSESRRAEQERWADVKCSLSFYRLCTYYQVLTAFWGEPPTPKQLDIAPLNAAKKTVFEML
ncbi:MAG: hypothetical protein E6Q97_31525 [Desulfurellales bacterium]|nr:MAG: hypothetical protein E6Q97_31525 [Desulfurellales bacterium]